MHQILDKCILQDLFIMLSSKDLIDMISLKYSIFSMLSSKDLVDMLSLKYLIFIMLSSKYVVFILSSKDLVLMLSSKDLFMLQSKDLVFTLSSNDLLFMLSWKVFTPLNSLVNRHCPSLLAISIQYFMVGRLTSIILCEYYIYS